MIVELHIVDLDCTVVARRVSERWSRLTGERQASGDGYRLAGPAYESSNIHECPPKKFPCGRHLLGLQGGSNVTT